MDTSMSDSIAGFKVLTDLIRRLHKMVSDDTEIRQITSRGERLIGEMTDFHKDQIHQLQQRYKQNVTEIRAIILQDTEAFLKWKKNTSRLLTECTLFVDRVKLQLQLRQEHGRDDGEKELGDKCQEKVTQLIEIQDSKPVPTDIAVSHQEEVFTQMLSKCLQVITSVRPKSKSMSQIASVKPRPQDTSQIVQKKTVLTPNYSKASYKAMNTGHMKVPMDVCTDPTTGNIITTDFGGPKIHVLDEALQKIRVFGSWGRGAREYSGPWGVVSDGTNIYICDSHNHRVCVTDVHGAVVRQFGSGGSGKGHFKHLTGLALDSHSQLYICDQGNHRIQVTDKHGMYVREFGQDVFGGGFPQFIAVSPDDKVAVTNHSGDIYLFTAGGQHKATIKRTPPHYIDAAGVVFDGHGHLLVSYHAGGRVAVMTESWEVVCFIGTDGQGPGQLWGPHGLTVTREGEIVVCDRGNNRLQLFSISHHNKPV